MTRQELDTRDSEVQSPDFYKVVVKEFNNPNVEIRSRVLPELHNDYIELFDLSLTNFPLTKDRAKDAVASQPIKVIRTCNNWEQSKMERINTQ